MRRNDTNRIIPTPYLSIVVPAYNEEERIGPTLSEAILYFSTKRFITEIIVVDDGSNDSTTRIVMRVFNDKDLRRHGNIRAYLKRHIENRGKGAAIKTGIQAASGRYILSIDADGSTPIAEFDALHAHAENYYIVVGSRDLGTHDKHERTQQKVIRDFVGRTGRLFTRVLFNLPVSDPFCGFKLIENRLAKELAEEQQMLGFGYDVEYLVRARRKGVDTKEVGVSWHHKQGGKLRLIQDSLKITSNLLKLHKQLNSTIMS